MDDKGVIRLMDVRGNMYAAAPSPAGSFVYGNAVRVGSLGPGRTLDVAQDAEGRFVLADAARGLLRWTPSLHESTAPKLEILSSHVDGSEAPVPERESARSAVRLAHALAVQRSTGDVFFADASSTPAALDRLGHWDVQRAYMLSLCQGSSSGRVLRWEASTGRTHAVAGDLWFPAALALAADEQSLVVAEMGSAKLTKIWLGGERAGRAEPFGQALPGVPRALAQASDGGFWVSVQGPVMPFLTATSGARWARYFVAWASNAIATRTVEWGCLIKLSAQGEVQRVFLDADGEHIKGVTSLHEAHGRLFMGFALHPHAALVDLAALEPQAAASA